MRFNIDIFHSPKRDMLRGLLYYKCSCQTKRELLFVSLKGTYSFIILKEHIISQFKTHTACHGIFVETCFSHSLKCHIVSQIKRAIMCL